MKQSNNNFDSEDHFESALARQYQQSKSTTKPPVDVKQHVLLKASRVDIEKRTVLLGYWLAQLAFAASALIFGFILLMPGSPESPQGLASHNIIEFHTLEEQPPAPDSKSRESIRIAYTKLEQEYARNSLLIATVQKQARLKINGDGSWELNTCEQHNFLLSGDLIAMLNKYHVLPDFPKSGMMVNIGFDDEGHIIQIEASPSSMLC